VTNVSVLIIACHVGNGHVSGTSASIALYFTISVRHRCLRSMSSRGPALGTSGYDGILRALGLARAT